LIILSEPDCPGTSAEETVYRRNQQLDWIVDPLMFDALGFADIFNFPRPWWWAGLVAELQLHIEREGLRPLILSSFKGRLICLSWLSIRQAL